MKKISIASILAASLITTCHAQTPWNALTSAITESMIATPLGDFSGRKVAVVDNGFIVDHANLRKVVAEGHNGRDINTDVTASVVKDPKHHEKGKICSHGTHVAGIIAQLNEHVEIVPLKRGSSGNRSTESDLNCLNALIGRTDIEVVNLSFGINWDKLISPIIQLAKEGKTIVIAAGNANTVVQDVYLPSQKKMLSRVLADLNGRVVLIGATRKTSRGIEKRAEFSNKPCNALAPFFIAAPGSDISSYVPLDAAPSGIQKKSGTSMASPVFVGALMRLATKFEISIDEARQVLFETAIKQDSAKTLVSQTGQGIIDFKAAWEFLKEKHKKNAAAKTISVPAEDLTKTHNLTLDEDLTKARIFNIEEINNMLARYLNQQTAEPKNDVIDIAPEEVKTDNQVVEDLTVEDLTTARLFVSPDEVKAPKNEAIEITLNETQPTNISEPISTQPPSQGYIAYGMDMVGNVLSRGYSAASSIINSVVTASQNTYNYLRSWF